MDADQLQQLTAQADQAYQNGSLDLAFELYQQVLATDPEQAPALNRVGAILAQRGDLDGAEQALRRTLELAPKLASGHSNLGNVLLSRGDAEGAVASYEAAIRLSPDVPVFHENLAAAYKKRGDITKMVAELKKARKAQGAAMAAESKTAVNKMKGKLGCAGSTLVVLVLGAILFYIL